MKRTIITMGVLAFVLSQTATAQEPYSLPFASKGNTIELAVENTSSFAVDRMTVAVTGAPEWLRFEETSLTFTGVKAKEMKTATFAFSVDKHAQVNKAQTLNFTVTSKSGEQWSKAITVNVSPPEKFALFQNYPNPYNPTTNIDYQLTQESNVTLKVYNVIGQEVATVSEGDREAGYHTEVFDASRLSSGMYIYQISAVGITGDRQEAHHKMMVIR